jgi:hypothetical protein
VGPLTPAAPWGSTAGGSAPTTRAQKRKKSVQQDIDEEGDQGGEDSGSEEESGSEQEAPARRSRSRKVDQLCKASMCSAAAQTMALH